MLSPPILQPGNNLQYLILGFVGGGGGVSPGAYRGAQGRSFKNTWKMFVFNCMIHFVTCIVTIFPITELLGYP